MSKIKFPKIILIIALLTISAWLFSVNAPTAKAVTAEELLAQIAKLQAQIAQLQKQLAELQGKPAVWCHDFNVNLKIDMGGEEVKALQTALEKEGFYKKEITGNFDEYTASAVVGFQEKYKEDILSPWGLEHGTGFVGKTTRAKLNELYGCGTVKPYITVISPNGGENWVVGNTYDIKWDSRGIEKVRITLEVGFQQTIPTPIPVLIVDDYPANLGKYSWVVQNLQGRWKIRIAGKTADGSVVSDLSDDYFSIVEKEIGLPDLTLISIRTDVYRDSFTFTICNEGKTDLYKNYADIDVKVTVNGITKTQGILSANLRAGSCTYGGPQFLYTDFNLERGKSYDLTAVVDPNNEFEESNELNNTFISQLQVPIETKFITVTSPNGGEKWVVGNTYDITWRSSGIEKVNIYLEDTSVMATIPCAPGEKCAPPYLESTIATGIPASSGKYSWTIPSNQTPKSTYRIRIADTNYSTTRIYDDSDSDFSIVSPTEKSITVTSPNGGEKWVRGKTYDITWNSVGVDKVDIYARKIDPTIVCAPCIVGMYCPPCDGTLIAKNVSASLGKYSWTIPLDIALGDKYKIQIGDTGFYWGQNNIYDESDNYFSIEKIAGDIDGDGDVDETDLQLFCKSYGKSKGEADYNPNADFDNSGRVDYLDLYVLARNYVPSLFTIPPLKGDIDGDCDVDDTDQSLFNATYGKSEGEAGYNPKADFDKSGKVDYLDLYVLSRNYGRTCLSLYGDIDGDCDVDGSDLSLLNASYGKSKGELGYNQKADFNEDGKVDYNDLYILARNYGKTCR